MKAETAFEWLAKLLQAVDLKLGQRQGACCWKTRAAELRVRIFRMKRQDLLFDETSINFIHDFYRFHDDNLGRSNFDRIIDQEYVPKLKQHKRGFSDMISAYDAAIADIEDELGRSSWSKIDGTKVYSVRPSFRRFEYRVQDLIVYENESCLINACEQQPWHLHVLLAKSKRSHLLTFKRFAKLITEMRQKYEVITAHVAEKPCSLVGKENDWRFEKNADNESRLLKFWRSLGFESFEKNKNVVKIESIAVKNY